MPLPGSSSFRPLIATSDARAPKLFPPPSCLVCGRVHDPTTDGLHVSDDGEHGRRMARCHQPRAVQAAACQPARVAACRPDGCRAASSGCIHAGPPEADAPSRQRAQRRGSDADTAHGGRQYERRTARGHRHYGGTWWQRRGWQWQRRQCCTGQCSWRCQQRKQQRCCAAGKVVARVATRCHRRSRRRVQAAAKVEFDLIDLHYVDPRQARHRRSGLLHRGGDTRPHPAGREDGLGRAEPVSLLLRGQQPIVRRAARARGPRLRLGVERQQHEAHPPRGADGT